MVGAGKARANRERAALRDQQNTDSSTSGNTSHSVATSDSPGRGRTDVLTQFDGPTEETAGKQPAMPVINKNIDYSMMANSISRGFDAGPIVARPKPSTLGQPVKIGLNMFTVTKMPSASSSSDPSLGINQWDVLIGSGVEKRGLIAKVWRSQEVQRQLVKDFTFDGNRLAWSIGRPKPEIRCIVDLDQEEGRQPKSGKQNKHRVFIRWVKKLSTAPLQAYLDNKTSFDASISEVLNFVDHVLRGKIFETRSNSLGFYLTIF